MYYEPYRPRRRTSCIGRLFRIALILAVLWVLLLLVTNLPISIGGFSLDALFSSGYNNILLLGMDNEVGAAARTRSSWPRWAAANSS